MLFRSREHKIQLEFSRPGAPQLDFVFTVCDNAANEVCPVWPGQPMTAHWGIEDPAKVVGSDIEREAAFVKAFKYLKNRIGAFTALPLRNISSLALERKLRDIGRLEGATERAVDAAEAERMPPRASQSRTAPR